MDEFTCLNNTTTFDCKEICRVLLSERNSSFVTDILTGGETGTIPYHTKLLGLAIVLNEIENKNKIKPIIFIHKPHQIDYLHPS